jgi:hypothetical protein
MTDEIVWVREQFAGFTAGWNSTGTGPEGLTWFASVHRAAGSGWQSLVIIDGKPFVQDQTGMGDWVDVVKREVATIVGRFA